MAKEWAATANQNGYANCYELDCTDLKVLDLNAEQRQKNINRAQAETLARIAKQLYCNIEDLLERV